MEESSMRQSEGSVNVTQDRIRYVRAGRPHLLGETRMLRMALEELQEEVVQMDGEEAVVRRLAEKKHRDLLRCLLRLAVSDDASTNGKAVAADDQVRQDAASALVCGVLTQCKDEQCACSDEAERRLPSIREKARQLRAKKKTGDTSTVQEHAHHHSSVISAAWSRRRNSNPFAPRWRVCEG
ncbi:hypothetical protein JKF63_02726 [Porcisia hertigi]|uniref:Uncharacterized protein n=1 Tax=Porcisia hertigi TaxID=2761500 RepID=A0A836HP62_9TRYP|nr:hypothetical protein JKF63_02726 [Porcisia hertigi]